MDTSPQPRAVDPADERVRLHVLAPMALQHLLVMIAGPISSVFLLAAALHLSPVGTANLLAALFGISGIGTLLQSLGLWRFGGRLPFVMLPGGAAVALFIQIAQATDAATATGSVLITAVFVTLVAPVFTRFVRLFPPVVLGSMIVVIGVNLIKINAALLVDSSGGPSGTALGLAAVTVLAIVAARRLLPDPWRRMAVMIGIVVGTVAAAAVGELGSIADGPALSWPHPLPFGRPHFDLLASVPLLLFSIGSMAEATGQSVVNAEVIGSPKARGGLIAGTIRGDGAVSLVSGLFGGPTMVTSGENVGIVELSGVRSRFVTAGTGAILVVLAFLAPVTRLVGAVPTPVVGAAGMVVFGMIAALGVRLLVGADLSDDGQLMTGVLALVAGLLPVLAPTTYVALSRDAQLVLGSGVTMAAAVGVITNLLFSGRPSRALLRPRAAASGPELGVSALE